MNKQCHKIIFNKKRGLMMVVAENTVRDGKSNADSEAPFNGGSSSLFMAVSIKAGQALKLLSFSLMLALGSAMIVSPIADARVVADPNAPGTQRPTILPSANGTPQVNIQKPTKGGVSMNQYKQFDVDKKGVILNNSRKNTQTQLGGMVQANPWLAGGSAKVIVNQVNSRNPSQLNGYVEVAGQKADVIIANQAGLSINGGGFINTHRAILTTGIPIIKDGLVAGYSVQGGSVNVHGEGLDVRDANYTRILTAAANLNGGVWGQNIDVVAGHYDLDANDQISTTTASPSAPTFAIDTGALGGMYAGKITLVSTDQGRGIQHQGQLFATAGGVSLTADGKLHNSGVINSNGTTDNVTIKANSIHNSGTVSSQHNQTIQTQDLTNTGLLASAQELNVQATDIVNDKGTFSAGRLDLSANTLSNQKGTLVQTGRQSLAIEAGHLKNHDQGLIGYTPVVDKPTEPTEGNGSGNEPNPEPKPKPDDGSTAPSTGTGGGQIETAPTVPVTLATGRIKVANQLDNTGQITANGGVDLTAHNGLNNSHASLNLNQLTVMGDALINESGSVLANQATIETQQINNTKGILQAQEQLLIKSDLVVNHEGLLASGKSTSLTVAQLDNSQSGKIVSQQDLTLHASKQINNQQGQILSGGRQEITTPVLNNQAGVIEANRAYIKVTELHNQEKGSIRVNEDLTIEASHSVHNQQGELTSAGDLNLSDQGQGQLVVHNQGGQLLAGKDLAIQSKSVGMDGTIAAGENLSLTVIDTLITQNELVAGKNLSISTQGDLINHTDLQGGQSVQLLAGNIDNQASGRIVAGEQVHVLTRGGLSNRGEINSNGRTLLEVGQTFNNIGTGKVYGDHIAISAQAVMNQDETLDGQTKAAVIAARDRLDIGATHIINQEEGLLYSGGLLSIGGHLNDDKQAEGLAETLINSSARIEAMGDGVIAVKDLKNIDTHFTVEEYLADSKRVKEWAFKGGEEKFVEGVDGQHIKGRKKARFVFNDGSPTLEGDQNAWHWWNYQQNTYKEKITNSKPSEIIIGGNLTASGDAWLNQDSKLIIGGKLLMDELGDLDNEETEAKQRIEQNGNWGGYSYKRKGVGKKKLREKTNGAYNQVDHSTYKFEDTPMVFEKETIVNHNSVVIGQNKVDGPQNVNGAQEATHIKTVPNVNTKLPNSSLFSINPDSGQYLVETDPRFTNGKQWLGSDYMLKMMGANPDNMHKRLGDGYYEQRLLNEQINQLTGYRRLEGYANDEDQFKALMNAGASFAQAQNVAPGVKLSAAQIARLTSDMVWLESETITLPNGQTQTVLVPKVYLAVKDGDLNGSGALISADSIQLSLKGDATNSGTIAGRQVVSLGAQNIDNFGTIAGGKVGLVAQDQLNVIGGQVIADDFLSLKGNEVTIASKTITSGDEQNGNTKLDRVAGLYVKNDQTGILSVAADNDLHIKGAVIENRAAEGQTQLSSEQGNVNIGTVAVANHETNGNINDKNHRIVHQTAEVGSLLQTEGDLTIMAGKTLNVRQSDIDSATGTTTLYGKEGVSLTEGRQTTDVDASFYNKSKGMLSSESALDQYQNSRNEAVGSNVTGHKVHIVSDQDILVRGSNIVSDEGTVLSAKNNVRIEAAQNTSESQENHVKKKSGLMGSGGLGFTVGKRESTLEQDGVSTTHSGSMVGSLNGDTTIVAGNQYTQIGSDVTAPKGDVFIQGQSIDVVSAMDTYATDTKETYKQSGLTVALSAPAVNAVLQAHDTVKGAEKVGKSKNDRVNAMAAANTAMSGYEAYAGAKDAADALQNDPSKVSVSITVGSSKSESETHIKGTEVVGSQIKAGGKTTLIATGAGQDSVINIVGSDVAGDKGTNLIAEGNINLLAAAQDHSERSSNKSSGWNAGVAIEYGKSGPAFGITAGGNVGKGYGNGDDVSYVNTTVGSQTGKTTLVSGNQINLVGAQIFGKGMEVEAKELNIESLQNTAKFNSKQENISGQVTVGYGASGSASYSKSKINADYASVNEQSGLFAGDDGYQINIKGNTDLKGGLITSTQLAEDAGKNQFTTGTLTSSDIQNYAEYKGSSVGISGSGGFNADLGLGDNAKHQSSAKDKAGNELDGKSSTQITQSMGYGSDKGSDSSTTHSGINTSNITITDAAGQQAKTGQSVQEVIDQIKTDVTTDTAAANSGHIGNNFDKDRVQKELDLQREVTEQFSKNAQTAKNMINTKQQELLDEVEKLKAKDKNDPRIAELLNEAQNWQTGGLLLDSVVGILSGPNTNGTIGTIANAGKPWIAAEIGNYFKQDENKDKEAAHIMAHTILGGAIAAATGNNALGGALSAGGGEALAPMVKDFLYGKETKIEDLTADQKQTISSIISLGGAGVGGIVSGSGSDAVSGGQLAGNSVDNNLLNNDWSYFGTTPEQTQALNAAKLKAKVCVGLSEAACQGRLKEVQIDSLKFIGGLALDFVPVVGDIKGFSEAETKGDYFFAVLGVIPFVGDAAKQIHKAEKAYEVAKKAGDVNGMKNAISSAGKHVDLASKAPGTVYNTQVIKQLEQGKLPGVAIGGPGTPRSMPTSMDPNGTAHDFASKALGREPTAAEYAKGATMNKGNCAGCWVATEKGVTVTYRPGGMASGRTDAGTATVEVNSAKINTLNAKDPTKKYPNGEPERLKLKFPKMGGE